MSMQSVLLARPPLARMFMSSMPSSFHDRNGRKMAMAAFRAALDTTSAYPEHLAAHGISRSDAIALAESSWTDLPITDKAGYIDAHPIEALVQNGAMHTGYTVERSSGLSGRSNYWFRTPTEDEAFPAFLEFAFRQFFGIDEMKTLIIIGLALGTWTSGEKMAQALRTVAAGGKYPLSVASPGHKGDEILELVQDLSPHYEQTIIVGYPPFLKHVIETGAQRGIDWKALNVKLGLGGEGYSEEWRDRMAEIIGVDVATDLLAISGGFGAADLGMFVGREYPLTVLIRRLARDDRDLAKVLFGDGLPMLFQYSPAGAFIEEVDGELVFSVLSGIPLVRYNIHDQGRVIPYERMMALLAEFGYDVRALVAKAGYAKTDVWKLPFFCCFGRSDGTVILAGANIHPDMISAALSRQGDMWIAGHKIGLQQNPASLDGRLTIALEHKEASVTDLELSRLADQYTGLLIDGLRRVSTEYTNLHDSMPERAIPVVHVYENGSGPFAADVGKMKRSYAL